MKSKSSIALIVAAIVLVAGLVIMGIAFTITGGLFSFSWGLGGGPQIEHFGFFDTPWSEDHRNEQTKSGQQGSEELSEFDSVDIGVVSANVTLIPSDEFKLEYRLSSNEEIKAFEVKNDGTLVFKTKSKFMLSFFSFNADNFVKIYYKTGTSFDKLELATTSGEITVPDVTAKTTSLISTSGNIEAEHISGDSATLSTISGSLLLNSGELKSRIETSSVSGNTSLNSLKGTAKLDASTTSGDIDITDCDGIGKADSSTVSGRIYLSGGFDEASFNSTSGDIKLLPTHPLDSYKIKTSTVSGTCSVNNDNFKNTYGNGDNLIDCSTVSGDIDLSFGK